MNSINAKSTSRQLWLAGVIVACIFAGFEIRSFLLATQDWATLLTLSGKITVAVYTFLLIFGVIGLLLSSEQSKKLSTIIEHLGFLRWVAIIFLFLVIVWFYLYSTWQTVWPGPWAQLLLAAGLVSWIARLASPQRDSGFRLSELMLSLGLFLYPRIVAEARLISTHSIVYRSVTILGLAFLIALTFILYSAWGERIKQALISIRSRLRHWRFVLVAIFVVSPLILRLVMGLDAYQTYANIRFAVLLTVLWLFVLVLGNQPERLMAGTDLLIASLALAVSFSVTAYFLEVVNYPFSLSWSEGNRFYDYSLVFGQSIYQYDGVIVNPYSSPGRYGLWGIMFLIPNLPIWFHRFWDAFVRTSLPLLLGWAVSRRVEQKTIRLIFFLWTSLFFLVQAPVHPPFVLALVVALIFAFDSSLWVRAISLFVASFYAGLSRWTWVVAPASWGVLIDLLMFYPKRDGSFWKKLIPTFVILVAGLLPGLIINLGTYSKLTEGQNVILNQPLLWYRLLPNPTYQLGVGPAMLLATGPVLIIIAWWLISKHWQTDWLQKLAVSGALTSFLVVGLIISAKIGGGGDLHNLDMYLAVLILIVMLGIISLLGRDDFHPGKWPLGIQAMLYILLIAASISFMPFSSYADNSSTRNLPSPAVTSQTLNKIRTEVASASSRGEVLFMDQRQLLSFGYINPIPFVPDYEKKYMMDQAMGSNADYFKQYYQDLARRRFDLIVTEPLRTKLQGAENAPFSEENDAWVRWVSRPTLCFYKPIFTDTQNNIQLLVPQATTDACNKYLTGE